MLLDMIGGLGHMISQGASHAVRALGGAASATQPADSSPQSIGAIQGAPMARDSRQASQPAGAQSSAFSLKDLMLAAIDTDRDGKVSQAEASAFLADLMGRPAEQNPGASELSGSSQPDPASRRLPDPSEFARIDLNGDGRVTGAEVRAREVLDAFDADKNGVISKKEYLSGTRGAERTRRDAGFDRMDANGDGKLDAGELVRGETPSSGDRAVAARLNATNLARFDSNGDGMVDGKEVAARNLLDRADRDGDRSLSLDEFMAQLPGPASAVAGEGFADVMARTAREVARLTEARARFQALDRDADGKLSAEELRGAVQPTQVDYRLAADLSEAAEA
ncbi:MAG TPA: EF-hand domain-containing protein [Pantanalinema sp.]